MKDLYENLSFTRAGTCLQWGEVVYFESAG